MLGITSQLAAAESPASASIQRLLYLACSLPISPPPPSSPLRTPFPRRAYATPKHAHNPVYPHETTLSRHARFGRIRSYYERQWEGALILNTSWADGERSQPVRKWSNIVPPLNFSTNGEAIVENKRQHSITDEDIVVTRNLHTQTTDQSGYGPDDDSPTVDEKDGND